MTQKLPKRNHSEKEASLKTIWDLSIFYADENDPRIEHDVRKAERACEKFVASYQKKKFTEKKSLLLKSLSEYEALMAMPEFDRPMRYFGFRRELDAGDTVADKRLNILSDRLTKAGNTLLFYELAIGAIAPSEKRSLLKDSNFSHYHYYLSELFADAKHRLTEPEERILNLKSLPASALWVAGSDKILNQRVVRFRGKDVPLMEALNLVNTLPTAPRRALWNTSIDACIEHAPIAENEINAIVLNKKINDELRGYPKPYSATVLGNENTEQSIEALVDAVTDRFDISARFYALKARMHGEQKLLYPDKNAPYGKGIRIPFTEAVDTLRAVFYDLNPEYGRILDRMLAGGQIDVYPKKGKSGGAFCASGVKQPTFVLLNQVDDMHSLTTFAHEMGHAIHSERSKTQPTLYQDYSTATAETASTLFENLVFETLLDTLTEREQIVALHGKLNDEIAAIMRQIAFFNFERDLHTTIRQEGSMTKEEMATLLQKHLSAYLGKKVSVTERDGYSFVYVPHFRMFFYVYTYAYGSLVSNVLSQKWKADSSYIKEIDTFLTAGGSASPETIFKSIGINTADPEFFKNGLKVLDEKVARLERLIKKS